MRQDKIGQERDKRMFNPNSAHTRPGGENSEKKIQNKFKKLKKQLSGVIFSENGMRQDEIEIKEFQTRIPLILGPGEKITKKNSKKIQKIREQLFGIIFSQIGFRQAEKE